MILALPFALKPLRPWVNWVRALNQQFQLLSNCPRRKAPAVNCQCPSLSLGIVLSGMSWVLHGHLFQLVWEPIRPVVPKMPLSKLIQTLLLKPTSNNKLARPILSEDISLIFHSAQLGKYFSQLIF